MTTKASISSTLSSSRAKCSKQSNAHHSRSVSKHFTTPTLVTIPHDRRKSSPQSTHLITSDDQSCLNKTFNCRSRVKSTYLSPKRVMTPSTVEWAQARKIKKDNSRMNPLEFLKANQPLTSKRLKRTSGANCSSWRNSSKMMIHKKNPNNKRRKTGSLHHPITPRVLAHQLKNTFTAKWKNKACLRINLHSHKINSKNYKRKIPWISMRKKAFRPGPKWWLKDNSSKKTNKMTFSVHPKLTGSTLLLSIPLTVVFPVTR